MVTLTGFSNLLLKANYSDKEWEDTIIKRGSFITGLKKLSLELEMSQNKIRLALNKLERTNEISIKTTNKYRVITITNYEGYQPNITNKPQSNNKQNTNRTQTNHNY